MDGELLRWLYHRLLHDPTLARTPGCTYGDGLVALVYFFAVLSERSPAWATCRKHWPIWCRAVLPKPLISTSQLNRRLKTDALRRLVTQLDAELRGRLPRGQAKVVDGKPLVINGYSHDPDAAWGKVPDGWANGYKLHVVADAQSGGIDALEVTPLDAGEATVLRRDLLPRLGDLRGGCTLRGDANYDSNPTYRAVADAGGRHVAQRRKPGTGLGHHPQHPDRLRAVRELEQTPGGLADHKRRRNRVEQVLAHLAKLPYGLSALPPFVRRLPRVRRWVAAKVVLYHLHLVLRPLAAQRAAA
jgi:hypothetical protein